jgi:anti-anti-sigma factor
MDFSFDGSDGALLIAVQGRMTHADYKGFRDILARINQDKPGRVVFDLAQVSFIDSSALGMLLIVRDAVQPDKRDVVLRNAHGQVENLIKVGKLNKFFTIE